MADLRVMWLTSHYPNPADPVTGVFFRTQARALARAGVKITVVAPTPWAPTPLPQLSRTWRQYRETPTRLSDHGVSVEYPRYLATPNQVFSGIPDRFIAAAAGWRRRWADYDLIHAHYSYPQGLAAVRLARSARLPLVITVHGDDASTYPASGPLALRRFRAAISNADRVLAVSEKLVRGTEQLTGRRPEMAPIGVDPRAYADLPSRRDARLRLRLDEDAFVVLFVGYVEERKGIRELVAAMKTAPLQDATCVVVGDGPQTSLLAESPNIRSEGRLPNELIPTYLAAADVLTLPSWDEGTPTVVVEAGAAGLPVAATAVGGTTALLSESRGWLFPPRDVPALAAALQQARADRVAAAERASRLRAYVQQYYDADANAQRLADVYRRTWARTTMSLARAG